MKADILDDYYQGTGSIGVGMGSVTESGGNLLENSKIDIESDFKVSMDSEAKKTSTTIRDYATVAFFTWLIIATIICARIFHLDVISSFYFVTVTFTSVGYGDIVPTTDGEKLFTAIFVLVSIVIIGLAFGILFASLTEAEENRIEKLRLSMLEDDKWVNDSRGEKRARDTDQPFNPLFDPNGRTLTVAAMILLLCITTGVTICKYEGYSWIDGVYFSIVSLSTVGYGDIVPKSTEARLATTFFIMFGTAAFAWASTSIACLPLMARTQKMQQKVLSQYGSSLDRRELLELVRVGHGGDEIKKKYCTKADFVLRMLLSLSIIELAEIQMCERRFDMLDITGDGKLSVADCVAEIEKIDRPTTLKYT
jgi:potassium channel subfamily K, other eukaryote